LMATALRLDELVNLIPAQYYIGKTVEEELEFANKYTQNKSNKAPKQEIKEASRKAKRARLDPAQHKTVVDAQNERVASEEAAAAAEEEGGAAEDGSNNDSDGAMEGQGKITIFEDASHSELRQRLAERISTLQSGRNAHLTKKTSQQKITASEKRKKAKAEAKRKRETLRGQKVVPGQHGPNGESSEDGAGPAAQVFSKFNFSTAPRVGKEKKKQGMNNPMQLLAKAQAEKEKLAKLKSSDPEMAEQKEKEALWKKALLRAGGSKVKDDTKLLKKAIRRKDSKKKKTKEEWRERTGIVNKSKMKQQKKRDDALHERARGKLDRKMNGGKKKQQPKPKKRPGFEGGSAAKKPKVKMTLQTGYKFKA